jgi:hypothetical protein
MLLFSDLTLLISNALSIKECIQIATVRTGTVINPVVKKYHK